MKVLLTYTIQAIVDITEEAASAARVMVEHMKPLYSSIMINPKAPNIAPNEEEVRDYKLIALAYVLRDAEANAAADLETIGVPALTQQQGKA